MPRKSWDFKPEHNEAHRRIAARALENYLVKELSRPENAELLNNLHVAAQNLAKSCTAFVSWEIPEEDVQYHSARIASILLQKAMKP